MPRETLSADSPICYALVLLLESQGDRPVELLREAYTGIANPGRDPACQILLVEAQFGPLSATLVQDFERILDVETLDALIVPASHTTTITEFRRQLLPLEE